VSAQQQRQQQQQQRDRTRQAAYAVCMQLCDGRPRCSSLARAAADALEYYTSYFNMAGYKLDTFAASLRSDLGIVFFQTVPVQK
jgi:hypothetical protein